MLELKLVQENDKRLLFHLLQKYLYEMTCFYDDDIDEEGNYAYRYFESYFSEESRKAIFILIDKKIAGFVLLNRHSYIDGCPDNVIAEFTIFPKYRKSHNASRAVELLFHHYPGKWEIKYHMRNTPAAKLWGQVTAPFHPEVHQLEENEIVLSFHTEETGINDQQYH